MRVIDCVIFSYEVDALTVRLVELAAVVDLHVIVQGDRTFRGVPREVIPVDGPQIRNHVVAMPPGCDPWTYEHMLRDASLTIAAEHAGRLDRFLVADGDEIPHPHAVRQAVRAPHPMILGTDYREWFMDWRAPDRWQLNHQPVFGTLPQLARASTARTHCAWPVASRTGWHLSTLGDAALAARKLSTFAHDEFDTPQWNDHDQLTRYRGDQTDILGRFRLESTTDLPTCAAQFPHLLAPRGDT